MNPLAKTLCLVMCKGAKAASLSVIVTIVIPVTSKDGIFTHHACISIDLVGSPKSSLVVAYYFADDCWWLYWRMLTFLSQNGRPERFLQPFMMTASHVFWVVSHWRSNSRKNNFGIHQRSFKTGGRSPLGGCPKQVLLYCVVLPSECSIYALFWWKCHNQNSSDLI